MATARNKGYFMSEENKHLQKKKLDRWEYVMMTNRYVKYRQRENKRVKKNKENKHLQKKKIDRWKFVMKTNRYVKYRQRENKNGKVSSKLEYTVLWKWRL